MRLDNRPRSRKPEGATQAHPWLLPKSHLGPVRRAVWPPPRPLGSSRVGWGAGQAGRLPKWTLVCEATSWTAGAWLFQAEGGRPGAGEVRTRNPLGALAVPTGPFRSPRQPRSDQWLDSSDSKKSEEEKQEASDDSGTREAGPRASPSPGQSGGEPAGCEPSGAALSSSCRYLM